MKRLNKLISGCASLALSVSLFGSLAQPGSVAADTDLALPKYLKLVEQASSQTWTQKPGSQLTGTIPAVVHIDIAPLAMVARNWDHQRRVDYVAKIRAAQDKVVPQIEALGGKIVGRFFHASSGLAIEIDASKLKDVRALGGVIAVRGVANYQLDLTETVPWIGAKAVQDLGVTGDGVDVAVIDSGIDYTHKKLGGSGLVSDYNSCYATNGTIGDCPFYPNAKVKGGWDWVGEQWPNGPLSSDPDPIDAEGHGTHVADIIGGLESSPGAGDKGVAPGVNLWSFKACSAVSSSCSGLALLLAVDDALDLDDSDYGLCTPGEDEGCRDYDPADVINMSLGSIYGQPEDDLTLFTNIAGYYGSLPVVSAGNSGDRPYIVGSPSTADAALSVAQSTVPSDKMFNIRAGSVTAKGVLQPWGPAIAGTISGALQYGNGAGGNLDGCAAFPAGSLNGKVLLVDRGACNISIKASNGSAAGAVLVIIANNSFSNTPPSFSFGGGTVTVPALTVTQNDGAALKTVLGSVATVAANDFIALQDDIVASSSRGPRIADGAIKPDIAAPGASVSAEVGTGTGKTAFGGTSGAAPMVSGAAALVIEAFEDRGLLDSDPGLDGPIASYAPVIKSLLMNSANPNTYIGGSFLAPITLQGAGRVDVLKAIQSEAIAFDVTDFYNYLNDPNGDPPCTVYPVLDVLIFSFFGFPPDCADDFPFGNDFFNAWNRQTASLSYGYEGAYQDFSETRKVVVLNLSDSKKTYNISKSFRYGDDATGSIALSTPSKVNVDAGAATLFDVKLTVKAKQLRNWSLDAGQFGASGTNIYCSDPTTCPTLQIFEHDGYVTLDGGANNRVSLPWQILPKRVADTYVSGKDSSSITLRNPTKDLTSPVDAFALVDISPNNCEIVDGFGDCVDPNYIPGILPGINTTAIDIHEAGVRSYAVPGLNAALGLPAAPSGALNDEVVEFGLTVYDAPYRASHNFPVEFDIYIDSDSNGVDDYVVFNFDLSLTGSDGRNAVFVADINPADGTRPLQPYFFSVTDFNSQNWILPVPASAVGITSNRPFKFFVLAFDAYFTGGLWDCSPFNNGKCGAAYHTYQTGLPKFAPNKTSFEILKSSSYKLTYTQPGGGATASPSQIGLLFMYKDAKVGRESDSVTLP